MSFIDLATLASHRRAELQARISVLTEKCDETHKYLENIKKQAENSMSLLNCSPSELKDQFLFAMKQLDEYIYTVTDVNLMILTAFKENSLPNLATAKKSLHKSNATLSLYQSKYDSMDNLSCPPISKSMKAKLNQTAPEAEILDIIEPIPSKTTPIISFCKEKKHKFKEDMMMAFSSSTSTLDFTDDVQDLNRNKDNNRRVFKPNYTNWLPGQRALLLDMPYKGCIMSVDGTQLWVITDSIDEVHSLMIDMSEFYSKTTFEEITLNQLKDMRFCAFYDRETHASYRCFFMNVVEGTDDIVQLFLVDTGEIQIVPLCIIQPLDQKFREKPPFIRCCHLAGIQINEMDNPDAVDACEKLLKKYMGMSCDIEVEDNFTESLGVYIYLSDGKLLNHLLVEQGLASPESSASGANCLKPVKELPEENDDFNIENNPEYDDPVEAVTGYKYRDEMDICKHYKGGPEPYCFKGSRCKKRHVLKHPGGWTLDRISVVCRGRKVALPSPGTKHQVFISSVQAHDCLHLQFIKPTESEDNSRRNFGTITPPMTLKRLIDDMNSAAGLASLKPLTVAPAPGELVAALYPPDGLWYRAQVLSLSFEEQSVQVRYVDYGNELCVKENNIRQLSLEHTMLPLQAVKFKIAGIAPRSNSKEDCQVVKQALIELVLDRILQALIVERSYDELVVDLLYKDVSVGVKLAEAKLVIMKEYSIQYDHDREMQIVIP